MTNKPADGSSSPQELAFFEELLAWVEGGPYSPLLQQRAAVDPVGFARDRSLARGLLQIVGDAALVSPDANQHRKALEALAETRRRELAPGWRRLVGQLVGGTQAGAMALRRGSGGLGLGKFKALYEIDEFELDLHLAEDGALIGQLVSKNPDGRIGEGGVVLLQTKAGELMTCPVEDGGEFFFSEAPREVIDLTLSMPELEISVRDVDLAGT